jgi:hypothetical protein
MAGPEELADAAYAVADEFRSGRWPELKGRAWGRVWERLVDELARRCPGFTREEYDRALDRGFVESR